MQEQKTKRNYKRETELQKNKVSRFGVVLTIKEGIILKKIISDNGCKNLSQLCKKIVHGEISIY